MDVVIVKNFEKLARKYHCTVDELYELSPWSILVPSSSHLELSEPIEHGWIPIGRSSLEFGSNNTMPSTLDEGWCPGKEVILDVGITYPRFMMRKLSNKAVTASGTLWRTRVQNAPLQTPSRVFDDLAVLTKLADTIRSPQSGAAKKQGSKIAVDDTNGNTNISYESYIKAKLISHRPEEVVSAALMLITPQSRTKSHATHEFLNGNFLSSSGNATVKLLVGQRDIGKLITEQTNILLALILLDVIRLHVRLPQHIPTSLQLGSAIFVECDIWVHPWTLRFDQLVQRLNPNAQAAARNAVVGLMTRLLKLTPVRMSLLWTITKLQAGGQIRDMEEVDLTPSDSSACEENDDEESEIVDDDELQRRNNRVFGVGVMEGGANLGLLSPSDRVFVSTLRKYQQIAYDWMKKRELPTPITAQYTETNPIWDQYKLASLPHDWREMYGQQPQAHRPTNTLWINHMSGVLSFHRPGASYNARGGILADQMGLGKTVEMLALVSSDIDPDSKQRAWKADGKAGTLIVVPLSLLPQWYKEIQRHLNINEYDIKVCTYHSSSEKLDSASYLKSFDVILTTYGTVLSESSKTSAFFKLRFHRVVLDESHTIKNRMSQTTRAILALQADLKWCLTGTPIQNTLNDIYTSFQFIGIEPWSHWTWWMKLMDPMLDEGTHIRRLQTLTTPILLRRTIQTIDPETGEPILQLTQKIVMDVWIQFSEKESSFYEKVFKSAKTEFEHIIGSDKAVNSYVSILQLLLRLRQTCCHPLLIYSGMAANTVSGNIDALMKAVARGPKTKTDTAPSKFLQKQVHKHLLKGQDAVLPLISDQEPAPHCPICLDPPECPVMAACGHVMCAECAKRTLRIAGKPVGSVGLRGSVQGARLKVNAAPCPVCRQPFNATTITPLQQEKKTQSWVDLLNHLMTSSDEDSEDTKQFYYSSKLKCLELILMKVIQRGYRCVVFSQWVKLLDIVARMLDYRKMPYNRLDGAMSATKRREEITVFTSIDPIYAPTDEPPNPEDFFSVPTLGDTVSVRWDEGLWETACVQYENWVKTRSGPNGGRVLLASLKAGGVGLNLTAANYLVMLDSWWNPAVEEQAMQRVHRIGQTLPVVIFRLYVIDSIEASILELHKMKEKRARGVLSTDEEVKPLAEQSRSLWSLEEMKLLFNA
eukprot:Blabericola_migrator_1__13459@NODE_970_length_5866_cov_22_974478_g672_i0_p1_GENE_NODE_970_length_5866_cov_22_974478_g672_i0NODE_970_length_5866_cov_22_974478_g672_i0_p1_ORF_typecomplete_len1158_score265_50SNF2_N/PF00176_23/7_8e67ResIII/PF04851_15/2_7e13Helicase_C/PF00271_31/2e03Helicase_C/PF00271_31/5_2e11HDA23/PF11496_8/10HDA23/PF11496_8/3_3e09zfC3HC4_3/PF13920_6/6_6e11zfC3HC4/PF00097_25/3_1e08zfC3HC4/PF00097_25/2_7e02zfRING_5/PF14634_6/5_6e08zfC3HC4_2/PF13923_6/5_6e07zfC3HC4_2/PF13923_6/1_8e02